MPGGFIANITKSLGVTGVVSAGSGVISLCASAATPAAVMGILGTTAATAAPFAGLLVLGGVLDWSKGKRDKEETQAEFRKIHAVLARMEMIKCDDKEWRGLLDELLEGRVCQTDTGEIFESMTIEIKTLLVKQGETISADMEQGFTGVRIYLAKITNGIDTIIDGQKNQATKEDTNEIKELLNKVLSERSSVGNESTAAQERDELDLAAGLHILVDRAEHGDELAKRAIADCDPNEATAALIAERKRIDEAKVATASRVRDHELILDRAIAVSAFITGDIANAKTALNRICELLPGDIMATNRLGHIAMMRCDFEEAIRHYTYVLDAAPNDSWCAAALGNLGSIELIRGKLDDAEKYQKKSLFINKKVGHKEGVSAALSNLGLIEKSRENLDMAEEYYKQSFAIDKEMGCKEGMASNLGNLGVLESMRGNFCTSIRYHNEALTINTKLEHKEGMASNLGNLGSIERMCGNLGAARKFIKKSLAIERDLGRKIGEASDLGNLGAIELVDENLEESSRYCKMSLVINKEIGHGMGQAGDLSNLGLIEQARGNMESAQELWEQSRDLYAQIGMPHMVEEVQGWIDGLD